MVTSCTALVAEKKISLSRAARLPILSRDGRSPNPSTIWRWHAHGVRSVKLETVNIGGRVMTSEEAVERFIERLSFAIAPDQQTPSQGKQRHEAATKRLAAAGI